MNFGYVKTMAISPEIKVCDVDFNEKSIISQLEFAKSKDAEVVVFPELVLTGSTANDLLGYEVLIDRVERALINIARYLEGKNMLVFIGAPLIVEGVIFSTAVCMFNGEILGVVSDSENQTVRRINIGEYKDVLFGNNLILKNELMDKMRVGVIVGEKKNNNLDYKNCSLIVNIISQNEYSGIDESIKRSVEYISKEFDCAFVSCNSGIGESTTDFVFSGFSLIAEKGEVLKKSKPFADKYIIADVDLSIKAHKKNIEESSVTISFSQQINGQTNRKYERLPFVKSGEEDLIIEIQAQGLARRIAHTNANKVVLGLSGGLDSTLALIVCDRAMSILKRDKKDILALTMPCYGTTSRTLENSIKLAKSYGVSIKKIDITKSVTRHLKDIGHDGKSHDPAYENAQARERTQVLMDTANMHNGFVVGTGDLSELALGFATYNGDHMSMYAVNASIPKTLVRHLTEYTARISKGKKKATLLDILDTPVSPELIPSENNTIKQVTEDIVGPYILHDFFIYNMLKRGFSPRKIYHIAVNTFEGEFDAKTILKWLKIFVRRFFTQQFKRSCMPDGVMATEISLSPRVGFSMPSDAISKLWLDQLENL